MITFQPHRDDWMGNTDAEITNQAYLCSNIAFRMATEWYRTTSVVPFYLYMQEMDFKKTKNKTVVFNKVIPVSGYLLEIDDFSAVPNFLTL